jgi:xanthine dehydrogenase accessory factor
VAVAEHPLPTALRLRAAFAFADVEGEVTVGGLTGVLARSPRDVHGAIAAGRVPVWTGDEGGLRDIVAPRVLVDARLKGLSDPTLDRSKAGVVIALGPGYEAGRHCHFVIETMRGPNLGAVIDSGSAAAHTGTPGDVLGLTEQRLLRSPKDGVVARVRAIGDFVDAGDVIATVAGATARAAISGMVRGLKLDGVRVSRGHKVGDIDPRRDLSLLSEPSDKAERVGAGVVAALRCLDPQRIPSNGASRT